MTVKYRITAGGDLRLMRQIHEVELGFDDDTQVDDGHELDDDHQLDDEKETAQELFAYLLGIPIEWVEAERLAFDDKGDLVVSELIEGTGAGLQLKTQKALAIQGELVEGGVD